MGLIQLSRPWDLQPPVAQAVGRGVPLADGLVRALLPSGTKMFDAVTQQFVTTVGTNITAEANEHGIAARTTATGSYWTFPVRSETRNSLSIGWIGRLYAGGQTLILRDASLSGGTIAHWSNSGWDMRVGGTDYTAAGTFATSTTYVAIMTANAASARLYVRGQGIRIDGGAPGSTDLATPWYLHHNYTGGASTLAATSLLCIWDRGLLPAQVLDWLANPWQIFEPRRIYIPYADAAAGTPTLTDPGWLVSGNQITPRGNYAF